MKPTDVNLLAALVLVSLAGPVSSQVSATRYIDDQGVEVIVNRSAARNAGTASATAATAALKELGSGNASIIQLDKERVQGARLASDPRLRITAVEQERRDRDRVSILKQELDDEARKYAAAMQRAKGASATGDKLSAAEMQRLTEELYGHQKNIQSLNAELQRTRTAQ